MARRRRPEPTWLNRLTVDAIHTDQIREHGGLPGLRDENALESALARPQQKWHHTGVTDLALLAAAYGLGLSHNHPDRDGNKRVAFLAMVTFLGLNGVEFSAPDADVVTMIVALAAGRVSDPALADWVRRSSSAQSP